MQMNCKRWINLDYIKLSKEISYALRHAPWEYELEMDENGFVDIQQLLSSINEENNYQKLIDKMDILQVIEISDKKRLEISGEKIRAMYGHSFPMQIKYDEEIPPSILYHGTAKRFLKSIMTEGLKPMSRQYVHLSADIETAILVGKRRDSEPVILQIDTVSALKFGIKFYHANEKVWLCKELPFQFLSNLQV